VRRHQAANLFEGATPPVCGATTSTLCHNHCDDSDRDPLSWAWYKAVETRSQDEQSIIQRQSGVEDIFGGLDNTIKDFEERSRIQRGIKKASPFLEYLKIAVNVCQMVPSIEPASGAAISIVKVITDVGHTWAM
jgi:hypothetical protein